MIQFKQTVSENILAFLDQTCPGHGLDTAQLCAMFEYPPDNTLGDLAFPCFKLSRIMRKAPPQIAAAIAESLISPVIKKAEPVNGYLNIFMADDYLTSNVLRRIEEQGER